jgi:uncharacterized membrane protein YoaK (UPF0700 family)/anti-anti-sigma regulatory factor
MLSGSAYSFRQKSRLAVSLSWIGGYTNVIAFLAMGTFVSHVTGTTTQFGRWVGAGDFGRAAFFGYLLLAFTSGAALSAFLTETAKRRGWHSKYVVPIGLEAMLLALLCVQLARTGPDQSGPVLYLSAGLAALAMGLQNATITKISGSVVRTTHLTGIFTDFGLEGVQYLFWWRDNMVKRRWERAGRLLRISSRHPSALRLMLLLSIAGSFCFGTVAGAIAYAHWAPLALVAPIAFLVWILYVDWRTPIADIHELVLLNEPERDLQGVIGKLLPAGVALYRASYGRRTASHRAPNFQSWLDRVSEHCRVLVLAISPLTRFDENAVMDLEAAVLRLHRERKKLILCGITPVQFKALDALGVARVMDVNNLCPDLEFAIARAMVALEDSRSDTDGRRLAGRTKDV